MSLNESIVKDAALEWCGEQTRCARTLIPAFSHGETEEKREAIWRPAVAGPAIPEEQSATHKEFLSVQIERKLSP